MGGGGNGSFIAKETAGNKFSDCRAKIPGREISGGLGAVSGANQMEIYVFLQWFPIHTGRSSKIVFFCS